MNHRTAHLLAVLKRLMFALLLRALAVCAFIGGGIVGWEFLERFTDHRIHGKVYEGMGMYYDTILFAFLELILIFIPRFRWKIPLFAAYFALMCWHWFPTYTPYRFLYHAVFGTAIMILAELIHKRFTKQTEESQ